MAQRLVTYSGQGVLSYVGIATLVTGGLRPAVTAELHADGWGSGVDYIGLDPIDASTVSIVIRMAVDCAYTGNNATPGLRASILSTTDPLGLALFNSVSLGVDSEELGCEGIGAGIGSGGIGGGIGITGGNQTVVPNPVNTTTLESQLEALLAVHQQQTANASPPAPASDDSFTKFAEKLGLSVGALAVVGLGFVLVLSRRK